MLFSHVAIILLLAGHAVECVPGKKSRRVRKLVKGVEQNVPAPTSNELTALSAEPTDISLAETSAASLPGNDEARSNGIICANCKIFESNKYSWRNL